MLAWQQLCRSATNMSDYVGEVTWLWQLAFLGECHLNFMYNAPIPPPPPEKEKSSWLLKQNYSRYKVFISVFFTDAKRTGACCWDCLPLWPAECGLFHSSLSGGPRRPTLSSSLWASLQTWITYSQVSTSVHINLWSQTSFIWLLFHCWWWVLPHATVTELKKNQCKLLNWWNCVCLFCLWPVLWLCAHMLIQTPLCMLCANINRK